MSGHTSHKIKIVSLKELPQRRKYFEENNSHIQYEFFDAINGRTVSDEVLNDINIFAEDLNDYTPGAKGCALSHRALWKECIETNQPMIIAEDDTVFRLDFCEQYNQLIEEIPENWDILTLSWGLDTTFITKDIDDGYTEFHMFQDHKNIDIEKFKRKKSKPNLFLQDFSIGTVCYAITPSGAKKFLDFCFPIENFTLSWEFNHPETSCRGMFKSEGIDVSMLSMKHMMNWYVATPQIVMTENIRSESTIRGENAL